MTTKDEICNLALFISGSTVQNELVGETEKRR